MSARRLVSYFGNRYLDHFERDLQELSDHGFDAVVHCVTEADLQWGMGRVAEMFAMTKDAGLECWADPWGLAGVFGGEAHSGYLARGGAVGPGHPDLLDLVRGWTDAVAGAGAEWVFWDEPDLGLGHDVDALLTFLHELSSHSRSCGLRSSVCLTSTGANAPAFAPLAGLDTVDDVGTDPYYRLDVDETDPSPAEHVGGWADRVRAAAERHGKTSHVWVQAFHVAEGDEHRIGECIDVAHARGVSRIGVWGFRACEALDIRPARPQLAWRVVGDALARVAAGDGARAVQDR